MFYKELKEKTIENKYNYIKNHEMYYTLNSWNGIKSIANNVKLYNLDLKNSWLDAYDALSQNDYININADIEYWEELHPFYKVGFNGRSGGYLVLYNKSNCRSVIPDILEDSTDFEDFKKEWESYYGCLTEEDVDSIYDLVCDFDKLCDLLVQEVDYLTDEYIKDKNNKIYAVVHKNTTDVKYQSYFEALEEYNKTMPYDSNDEVKLIDKNLNTYYYKGGIGREI